ncbi:hypothetical protein FIBSPDRAFT_893748 [Athelia psychrophila]|uniref:Uncharacterized protein n=1 Tax=Athelia psychrophila TaxID=1759441 RepID=A0A166GNL0_9AGAM|nr:hypothetical protein FIBSPDRAFT_893748 [Fibularhizoctonia sp. CBS 109695]
MHTSVSARIRTSTEYLRDNGGSCGGASEENMKLSHCFVKTRPMFALLQHVNSNCTAFSSTPPYTVGRTAVVGPAGYKRLVVEVGLGSAQRQSLRPESVILIGVTSLTRPLGPHRVTILSLVDYQHHGQGGRGIFSTSSRHLRSVAALQWCLKISELHRNCNYSMLFTTTWSLWEDRVEDILVGGGANIHELFRSAMTTGGGRPGVLAWLATAT